MIKTIEYIYIIVFMIRPAIDLFWDDELFLGMNLAGITSVVLVGMLAVYMLSIKRTTFNGVSLSGMAFIFLLFATTTINATSFTDFDFLLRYCSSIGFYIILAPRLSDSTFNKCIVVFLAFTIIPIFITFFQAMGIVEYTYWDYVNGVKIARGSGGYHQPSVLTRFCIFGILYVLYLLENAEKRKILYYIYLACNIVAILLSYHRTGYLLVVAMVGLWYWLKYKRDLIRYVGKVIVVGMVLICLFVILYLNDVFSIDLNIFKRMLSLENIFMIEDGNVVLILRGRIKMLNSLMEGFRNNPVIYTLFGNGTDMNKISGISMTVADMDFIRIIWNCGLMGFGIWILHLHELRKTIKKSRNLVGMTSKVRLSICMFVCFVVWGFTLEATVTPNIMYHLYLCCGYVYYSSLRENRHKALMLVGVGE